MGKLPLELCPCVVNVVVSLDGQVGGHAGQQQPQSPSRVERGLGQIPATNLHAARRTQALVKQATEFPVKP